jgi:hypothetical protein
MRMKKESSKGEPAPTPSRPSPVRAPWDDGRCGGWVGPAPGSPLERDWEYQQWIRDTDRK